MTRKEIKKEFISFLKENDAYEKYMHNIKPENQGWPLLYPKSDLNEMIRLGLYSHLISGAFKFEAMPEKKRYWLKLSDKWRKKAKQLGVKDTDIFNH